MAHRAGLRRWLRLTEGVNPIVWVVVGVGILALLGLVIVLMVQRPDWADPLPDPPRARLIEPFGDHEFVNMIHIRIDRDNRVSMPDRAIALDQLEALLARHWSDTRREWFEDGERVVTHAGIVLYPDHRARWRTLRRVLAAAEGAGCPWVLVRVHAGEHPYSEGYLPLVLADARPADLGPEEKEDLEAARQKEEVVIRSLELPDVRPDDRERMGPRLRLEIDPDTSVQDVVALLECYGNTVPLVGLR